MRRIAMVGSFAALMLGACASLQKQQPAEPPPLTLVTHAEAQAAANSGAPDRRGASGPATRRKCVKRSKLHAESGGVADVQDGPRRALRV